MVNQTADLFPVPTALIVDPEVHACDRYALMLRDVVTDARDALVKALRRPPGLIVADTQLAFIDGYALYVHLRGDVNTERILIVHVAPAQRRDAVGRAARAGATALLTKPVTTAPCIA